MRFLKMKGGPKHHSKWTALLLTGCIVFFLGSGAMLLWAATLKAPDIQAFETRKVRQSTKIYDRTGEIMLYELRNEVKRTVVSIDDISPNLQKAAVAIEDDKFYEHNGIRPLAFLRAVLANLLELEFAQGGSTITQQVVKNAILVSDKSPARKLKEWVLAVRLEQELSKEEILEIYLNESPYGGELYGAEEASKAFFGIPASDLSMAQAAYLAALPQAPTFYSPYGSHRDRLDSRKDLVLQQMLVNKFITEEEFTSAKNEVVEFLPPSSEGLRAPHFVMFVREYLENKYGAEAIEEGGFRVTTTLDYALQEKAEEIANRHALQNTETYNASNAAFAAVDPKTGGILAMVGSRNYFDKEIDGAFNAAASKNRQPGSSFKPFVYAEAFRKGYTPDTVVFDVKTQFQTTCPPENTTSDNGCFSPGNYDNTYKGPMTLRDALAQSVNVPAVKVLYLAGLRDSLRLAQGMGITTLSDPNRYGLTLVLGAGEVSLLEMTGAYSVFANEGVRNPPTPILKVEDVNGTILEEYTPHPSKVLDTNIARTISDVLSDNEARTPAFGARSYLYFGNTDVAVKTGTTNEYRDAWIIGYTPEIAIGAWAGNNDNTPMEKKVAGFIVAPMWNEVVQEAIALGYGDQQFALPSLPDPNTLKPVLRGDWQGGDTYTIDKVSGKLATEWTPEEAREERAVKGVHSILHWVDKSDPLGPIPTNPSKDSQYGLWEFGVLRWKIANNYADENPDNVIPKELDNVHHPDTVPTMAVVSPPQSLAVRRGEQINVAINWQGTFPQTSVEYLLNGRLIGQTTSSPYQYTINTASADVVDGQNTLTVIGRDQGLYKLQQDVLFFVNP